VTLFALSFLGYRSNTLMQRSITTTTINLRKEQNHQDQYLRTNVRPIHPVVVEVFQSGPKLTKKQKTKKDLSTTGDVKNKQCQIYAWEYYMSRAFIVKGKKGRSGMCCLCHG